jgi:hypothetical protein
MTTCHPSCLCRCGQQGCGCRETSSEPTRRATPAYSCNLCGQGARAIKVVSDSGTALLVKKCPRCDVRRCSGDEGCGHYEQNPRAAQCSNCHKEL